MSVSDMRASGGRLSRIIASLIGATGCPGYLLRHPPRTLNSGAVFFASRRSLGNQRAAIGTQPAPKLLQIRQHLEQENAGQNRDHVGPGQRLRLERDGE